MSYFIFLLSLAAYVSSAPVGPVSHVSVTVAPTPAVVAPVAGGGERVGWTSDPAGRGTSKIIMSCGLTLALCIWTAIHPDLPAATSNRDRFRQKLYISFKALLIPEEVFTDARKQWIRAFQLYRALIAGHYILHHLNEEPQALFGKEVTFFVVQGGFVREDGSTISTSDIYSAFMTDPENVCNQIKVEDIRDKGNANVLTKLIVSFQCGWYVVNLILRLITGLPIAFLELHVMIHIITTLAIYMFWWNKQLDVSEPIILKIPEFKYHPTWAQVPITAVQPSTDPWKLPLNTVWAVPPEKNKSHWEDAIKQLRELGEEL
ncbi:hypothetical protein DFP73DRAFT_505522, partial [Morchella snyderi]